MDRDSIIRRRKRAGGNTVGAGDSYIAAFTYGVSLGESIPQCMARGKALATRIVQQFEPYLQEKEQ